jgi:signal transduction histidine kinase
MAAMARWGSLVRRIFSSLAFAFWSACIAQSVAIADPISSRQDKVLPPRSILVLNEAAMIGPFYSAAYAALRSSLANKSVKPVSLFLEQLELERFNGSSYEQSLKTYFRAKYSNEPIGVIVAFGFGALDVILRLQKDLWSGVPVVFVMVDEASLRQLDIPPNVTGYTTRVSFEDMLKAARAVVPKLRHVAILGDDWNIQTAFRHLGEQIPKSSSGLEIIDFVGRPMRELKTRSATLPDQTVILYTSIFSDGEGTSFPPIDGLKYIAEVANRPIVVGAETFVGQGAVGGYVLTPESLGQEGANLALRILDGESVSEIPIAPGHSVKPIFDWRQLRRWNVKEANLPPGSEIRFREPTMWEQYHTEILVGLAIVALQSILLTILMIERYRRHAAEEESRQRIRQVIHLNRTATAGAMSASVAHELNQPLGAILNYAETAQILLSEKAVNVTLLQEIIADIRRDDQRASEIIKNLRGLLKQKSENDLQTFNLNDAVNVAIQILEPEASKRNIALDSVNARTSFPVRAEPVQLQQVILNLVANGMDAVSSCPTSRRRLMIQAISGGHSDVEVMVSDWGPGIPKEALKRIFETFYTTKSTGTGLGLSIARTIIETYGGRIWAENREGGGAVFRFTMPLAKEPLSAC